MKGFAGGLVLKHKVARKWSMLSRRYSPIPPLPYTLLFSPPLPSPPFPSLPLPPTYFTPLSFTTLLISRLSVTHEFLSSD